MSYYFTVSGDDVWDPALRIGHLFVSLADGAAVVLGIPSGLAPSDDDTCEVDPQVFPRFVGALFECYSESRHPVRRDLIRGILLTSLVLLDRGGLEVPPGFRGERELVEAVRLLAKAM
ncbi:DUF6086 family protein [Micromonospora chokoriensis]|uniref:Uncharacterized protein n=1 Tax=Micromonospora chokoriensis TaxID=356851 RepID=A0A1C4ZAM4_9ACTN|nr:hypothetical protein GA0070612_6095 [Micromonospora chokoriensis]